MGHGLWRAADATGGRDAACAALRAQATPAAQAAIDNALAANHLDAIVGPTNSPAWVTDPVNGDLSGDFSKFIGSSGPAAVAGYADITVPAAYRAISRSASPSSAAAGTSRS